ncbi:hypothetical protein JCM6882_007194 [Rhodosporidiobolus microsporus]
MANKLEKRVQGQRRSFLPLSNQPFEPPSEPSSAIPPSSHKRSVSAPFGTARPGHARSRSWLASLLKPAVKPEASAPAPPPKDPAASRRAASSPGPVPTRAKHGDVDTNPYAQLAGKENEKPLPPVLRTLSPVAEERSFVSVASPMSTFSSLPPQRELQQRLASWDWSSEGGDGPCETLSSTHSSRRTTLSREEEQVYSGEDARGRNSDGAVAPGLFASSEALSDHSQPSTALPPQPFERVEPESSYLDVPALPASATLPALVNFGNPFSADAPSTQYLSAILPSRPPSNLSFVTTTEPSSSSSRPPLHIDTHPPPSRKVSDVSASVYSRNASFAYGDENDTPETAVPNPVLQSYFSPITPADVRTPLSGLAIPGTVTPVSPPRSPQTTRRASRSSVSQRSSARTTRVASTSSHTTTTSLHPSPIFDVDIFSHPPSSVRTAASSAFEPSNLLLSPRGEVKPPSPARPASSASSGSHQGVWREDWTIDARMSRYFPPQEESTEEEEEKENERELSMAEESRRIEEYCIRELSRRKQERHRRYLDERQTLYGESEADVAYGAAV